MTMLEHPLWLEDRCVREESLDERPKGEKPGTIAIHWKDGTGAHTLFLSGNDADDLMERYRAAADGWAQTLVLHQTIWESII